jgi:hypothetical protein
MAQAPAELGAWAGGKVVDGAKSLGSAAVHGGQQALNATGHALSSGAHWAEGQAASAWHSLTGR